MVFVVKVCVMDKKDKNMLTDHDLKESFRKVMESSYIIYIKKGGEPGEIKVLKNVIRVV